MHGPSRTYIRQALAGEPITVAGDGSQTRSVCYVDDLVEWIVRVLHHEHPGPMNLGNPHEVSVLRPAEWIRDLCGSASEITFVPRPQDDPSAVTTPEVSAKPFRLGGGVCYGSGPGPAALCQTSESPARRPD